MTETNNTHRINRANLWSRIAYLAGIMLLGMVITSILALPFASLLPKVEIMRLTQLISPVFIFILPAVLYARKFDGGIRRYQLS